MKLWDLKHMHIVISICFVFRMVYSCNVCSFCVKILWIRFVGEECFHFLLMNVLFINVFRCGHFLSEKWLCRLSE